MTYKEYDNIEIDESNMPCKTPCTIVMYEDVFRNAGNPELAQFPTLEDRYVNREAVITGASSLMVTNHAHLDYVFPAPVVRNGDYVYMFSKPIEEDGTKRINVREYKISTNSHTDVLAYIFNSTRATSADYQISFLDERKVLVVEEKHSIGAYPYDFYTYIWLVDFATETSTKLIEIQTDEPSVRTVEIQGIRTLKKDNGDIWIYLIGWHYDYSIHGGTDFVGGVSIYYYNYTQGGDWGNTYIDVEPHEEDGISLESIIYQDAVFINKDYLVVIGSTSFSPAYYGGGFTGYAFDLNTNTIARSELYQNTDGWSEPLCFFSAPNNYTGVLYFQAYQFYDKGTAVMKFDPGTLEISTIYTANDPGLDWDIGMFSTRCDAYFYDGASNVLYKAEKLKRIGDFSSIFEDSWNMIWGPTTYTLDDNSPSFWYWDSTNGVLKQIDFNRTIINSYPLPDTEGGYQSLLFHVGTHLVLELADVSYGQSTTKYYLIS